MNQTYGTVAVKSVYVRAKPGGTIRGTIYRGERVRIVDTVQHEKLWHMVHVMSSALDGSVLASEITIEKQKPSHIDYPPDVAPIEHREPLSKHDHGPLVFLGGLGVFIVLLWLFGAF